MSEVTAFISSVEAVDPIWDNTIKIVKE